jgi:hypothetical protein
VTVHPIPHNERQDCSMVLCPSRATVRVIIGTGHHQYKKPLCRDCFAAFVDDLERTRGEGVKP